MSARILIIEDDRTIRVGLEDSLNGHGWEVSAAADGQTGLDMAYSWNPDLIILDIMLPGINGYEICRSIRLENTMTLILMLTAKGQNEDIIRGLELGADDYLVKPFALAVLTARIKALLRRTHSDAEHFTFGENGVLDATSRKVVLGGREIALTPKEFDLLTCFLQNSGRALSREKIIAQVWGHGIFITQRSVDRCVKTLRQKLGDAGSDIHSVRGLGYRWEGSEF